MSKQSEHVDTILPLINAARERLKMMQKDEISLRDINLIWQTYSDIELAVGLTRFLALSDQMLGSFREITASTRNDPSVLSLEELRKKMAFTDSELEVAARNLGSNPKESLASLRKARDALKILILGYKKSKRGTKSSQ